MTARLDAARDVLRPHLPELSARRPGLYWLDLLVTASIAWTSLAIAIAATRTATSLALALVALLAFYRASAFIHEISHGRDAVRGFELAWNLLVGIPLLFPSLLYVGVHTVHHAAPVFGTERDPEYVHLTGRGVGRHLLLVLAFTFTAVPLLLRWLVVAPISILHPRIRRVVIERMSSFAVNDAYRRAMPRGAARTRFVLLEGACFVWSVVLALSAQGGLLAPRTLGLLAIVVLGMGFLHGIRTFATHRFDGAGAPMSLDAQYLDSINVTGHPLFTELWAPVGLRYHALHHLAAGLPYHALGTAHRLLLAALPESDAYRASTFASLPHVLARTLRDARTHRAVEVARG